MPDIEIDTSQLAFPFFAIPEAGTGQLGGLSSTPSRVALPVADGYHLQQGAGPLADFTFDVKADGTVHFDAAFDGFLGGRGGALLTVRGLQVTLNAAALDHGLQLWLGDASLPVHGSRNLSLLPSPQYRLNGTPGTTGHMDFCLAPDGTVQLDQKFTGCATPRGDTLEVKGCKIAIDISKLDHDLTAPLAPENITLYCHQTRELTLFPATGYQLIVGSGAVTHWTFGVGLDGDVSLDPAVAPAQAQGGRLTVMGHKVTIDTHELDFSRLLFQPGTAQGENGPYLPRASNNELTVMPATGYRFQAGSAVVEWSFGVGLDGKIILDPSLAFADAEGDRLEIHGYKVTIDGTALSHNLYILDPEIRIPCTETRQLTLIPANNYQLLAGSAIVNWLFHVRTDGTFSFDETCDGFLAGRGTNTLVLHGYPMVLDATHADSDLIGINNAGLPAQTPRELYAVLLPTRGYLPQTQHGVCRKGFAVERDGTITPDPAAGSSYEVKTSSSSNSSKDGQEVTIRASVRSVQPGQSMPQGSLTFTAGTTLLGSAPLDVNGRASLRTSALPPGDHDIVIDYRGDEHFQPSTTSVRVRHCVD
ncbi:Ig-like domain-containing protein (plasmid) [Streptomyces sp. NBC_01724]|uniref:Ig-like domain-containing protein n=1 Tax=Streptomyces sp. NBC_01724 TaxID=2975922 RepID=UPI002E35EA23|nr:Ig-like domain-containing protein [Streptomyces sp. NBC_01724]